MYNSSIPEEMKAVAKEFNQNAMRFVDYNDFLDNIRSLRINLLNDRAILRAYHFIKEKTDSYFAHMEKVFGENCCTKLAIRDTPAGRII